MLRFIRNRYVWYTAVFMGVVAIFTYMVEPNLPLDSGEWHSTTVAIRNFVCLAIVAFSSWRLGYRGGFVTCLAIVLISLPHVVTEATTEEYGITLVADYMMFVPTGVVTAWLFGSLKNSKIKLTDSEVRYRRLFETAQDAILILNGDTGQIIDANPFIEDLLGLSLEELIGKQLWEIGEFKDTLAGKISYQELHESGYKRWDNLPLVAKDGRIISVEVVANSYQVDHNRVIQCNIRDMTVAERAVKALTEVKQDLEIAQRLTGIGNWRWIIAIDKVTWSEELCRINGWDPNLPVPPFAEMGRFYTSESWERLNVLVAKAFNTGEPYACELEQIRTDGTGITTFSRGEADFDAGGKVTGLHGTVQDITGRKKMENVIQRSSEFFRAIFNSTNDAILVIDVRDFTVVRANDAFLRQKGLKEEQVIGKTCHELTHNRLDPCSPPDDICPLVNTLATGEHSIVEHIHFGQGNEKKIVEVSTSPLRDENGKVVQVVHVTRDLTEHRKLQEQLIAQDRLASIGQLVSGVAHELNNPLTSVIGFSELLLQRELPDDISSDLRIINNEAKRTSLIVKNLLTFARQQPQEKRAVDINAPIRTVLQLRSHEQSINNIKVDTYFAPNLPSIMGNSSQLQQVFFNLVTNAEQAMLEACNKGTLTITTKQGEGIIRVAITDDGTGITPENMRKLFTPFFTTKGVGKGTGLGLSICQGIITEHNGRIWAESESGKGTTFIIELPVSNGPIP